MAGNAIIGALRVVLGADTAQLDKGLKDAQGRFANFAKQITNIGLISAGAFAGIAGGMAVAIKQTLNEADKLGKLAQSIGVPVDELSKLRHAADLSGVTLESFGTAMTRFSKNVSEGSDTLRIMGVSIRNTDGSLKSNSVLLSEVAEKFAGYQDGANKTALAVSLFGRSGAELIPMLNAGASGIEDMKAEAEKLGLVIDSKTARAAENFNDNLTRLGRVKDGIVTKITAQMAPAFATLSERLVTVAGDSDNLRRFGEGLQTVLLQVAQQAAAVVLAVSRLAPEFKALFDFIKSLATFDTSAIGAAWQRVQQEGAETDRQFGQLRATFAEIGKAGSDMGAVVAGSLGGFQSPLAAVLDQSKQISDEAIRIGENFLKVQAPALAQIGADTKIAAEGLRLYNQSQREAQQLLTEGQTPLESYRQKLADISMAQWQNGWDADTTAKLQEAAARKAGLAWDQQAASMAGSFQKIGEAFAGESKSMAATAKVMGIVQTTVAMIQAGAEALKLGFPLGLAASATMLAQGAALVAQMKAVKVPSASMATGGSFVVPGSGGPDSKSYLMNLTPGEEVEVKRPGDFGYNGGRGAADATFNINLPARRNLFTRDDIRDLMEQIGDAMGDGYRFRVA